MLLAVMMPVFVMFVLLVLLVVFVVAVAMMMSGSTVVVF
jgi:hypothetical protein